MTGFILKTALAIEAIGALVLALRFCPEFGLGKGIWYGIFHAVSAFCNAGFDLMGDKAAFSSLTDYTGDPVINAAVCLLIVLGGPGLSRLAGRRRPPLARESVPPAEQARPEHHGSSAGGGGLFYGLYEFAQAQWAWT